MHLPTLSHSALACLLPWELRAGGPGEGSFQRLAFGDTARVEKGTEQVWRHKWQVTNGSISQKGGWERPLFTVRAGHGRVSWRGQDLSKGRGEGHKGAGGPGLSER